MSIYLIWSNLVTYSMQVGMLVGLAAFIPNLLRLRLPGARLAWAAALRDEAAEAFRKLEAEAQGVSPTWSETAWWADYVLPESTYLERWELVEPVPSVATA